MTKALSKVQKELKIFKLNLAYEGDITAMKCKNDKFIWLSKYSEFFFGRLLLTILMKGAILEPLRFKNLPKIIQLEDIIYRPGTLVITQWNK